MASLSAVLTEASVRQASDITLETGQPAVIGTPKGPEPMGEVMGEEDLFEVLTEVLGPEEQAELAVGNVLSFDVDLDGRAWSMVVEPGPTGIIVRGTAAGGAPRAPESGGLELPPIELEDDDDDIAPAGSSARWKELASQRGVEDEEIGLALPALDDDDDDETVVTFGTMETEAAPGGTSDEISFADVEADDEVSFADVEPGPVGGQVDAAPVGTPPMQPSTPPMSPPMPPMSPPMPPMQPPPAGPSAAGSAPTLAMSAAGSGPAAASVSAPPPDPAPGPAPQPGPAPGPPTGPLMRPGSYPAGGMPVPKARPDRAGLGQHAGLLEPGMLAFLRGEDLAEDLAEALGVSCHVATDDATPDWSELDPGALVAVRCDDPSPHLGWILRRLEEGVRIVVETRALTPEGARRVLLGVDASPRAEQWLDQRPMRWFAHGPSGWTAL